MAIALGEPGVDGLSEAVQALREWQSEAASLQLHPGDLGWFWRSGPGNVMDRLLRSDCWMVPSCCD